MKRTLWTLALITVSACGGLTQAQQNMAPQKEYYIGEGDVDLFAGSFAYANTDITIGRADQGSALSLTRYFGVHQQSAVWCQYRAQP